MPRRAFGSSAGTTLASVPGDAGGRQPAIVGADGEVYRFPVGAFAEASVHDHKIVFNGGLGYVMMYLAGAVSSGLVGNAAYDAFKLGGKSIRLRFAWGHRQEQRLFANYMAELAVRAKLDHDATVEVTEVKRYDDHWAAMVKTEVNNYRVMIPLEAPNETVVSVELT